MNPNDYCINCKKYIFNRSGKTRHCRECRVLYNLIKLWEGKIKVANKFIFQKKLRIKELKTLMKERKKSKLPLVVPEHLVLTGSQRKTKLSKI